MQTLLHEAARGQPGMKSLQVEEQKWKFKFPLLSAAVHTYIYKKYDIKMALSVRITCSHTLIHTHTRSVLSRREGQSWKQSSDSDRLSGCEVGCGAGC